MKRANRFFLSIGLMVSLPFLCFAAPLTIVDQGVSDYRIYSSPSALPSEAYAAEMLQDYLARISGCTLPIVHEAAADGKIVYVGFADAPVSVLGDLDPETFGKEEYVIQQSGDALLIAGGAPRGTLYGVIGFLRDHFGCRWYTRDVTKIPQAKTLEVDGLPDRQSPAFAYREPWYREVHDIDFAVHNRLNPSMVPIPEEKGGRFVIYPFVHTFNQLVPPEEYFDQHPEYFSLVDGKRQREGNRVQLCLTNPEVLRIATDTVLRWIAEHPEADVFSIDQNDGYGYCECPDCSALDEAEGSHSGTLLHFVNEIADVVAEKHPDVRLQTLAYVYSEVPPKTVRPRPNVTIRMCHYEYCEAHAIGQCDDHDVFVERLEGWSKITDSITIWDYYTNFRHYLIPYPNFESVIHHPRFYAEHNCIGLFAQGNNVREHGGGEFSALRAWVFAQLMWNPYQDGNALIDEFVDNVYGPAAPYIAEYIQLAREAVKPASMRFSIFASLEQMSYLTPDFLDRADALFEKAEAAAKGDPDLLRRVQLAHLPIHYARLQFYLVGGADYLSRERAPAVLEAFTRTMRDHQIKQFGEQFGEDAISEFVQSVKAAPEYITDWKLLGPFDNTDRAGFDTAYPPESGIDLEASYTGAGGETIRWKEYEPGRTGYVDLARAICPDDAPGVAYAYRTFEADRNKTLQVSLGSNDGIQLWLNGERLLSSKASRTARPGDESVELPLKKGLNTVLLKVDQLGGGWGFYFAVGVKP
ncbi:MAG: DUF4838 domain-containing protein [Candidatus Omnitrophica bacterium]|nr:DUF4838 domain-containing protein [Candidatus Omnitrophota bacterium]